MPHAPWAMSHEIGGSVLQPAGGSCHADVPSSDTPQIRSASSVALEGAVCGRVKAKDSCSRFSPLSDLCGAAATAQDPMVWPETACPCVVITSSGSAQGLDRI